DAGRSGREPRPGAAGAGACRRSSPAGASSVSASGRGAGSDRKEVAPM
ncbi:MAG: hypothetical protein AVDCRST_MAG91-1401, partial [uncultured Sphingomonadaceae bacterium]